MKVAFRVDASLQIGSGHVMRCLTLANALRERGEDCCFVTRLHTGNLVDLITQQGHRVAALPTGRADLPVRHGDYTAWLGMSWQDDAAQTASYLVEDTPDWLIVDHYALDHRWQARLRASCARLMVIDDLADRAHDCNLLLDQNLGRTPESYSGLTGADTIVLAGQAYALLRPDFVAWRDRSLARRVSARCETVMITMGGVDRDGVGGQVLEVLNELPTTEDLRVIVVTSARSPRFDQLRSQANISRWPVEILVDVDNMAELMARSDLAIGAAGGTAWERCVLGLPSIVLAIADNQKPGAAALKNAGAAWVASGMTDVSELMQFILSDEGPAQLRHVSATAARLTDGEGVSRVIRAMENHHV